MTCVELPASSSQDHSTTRGIVNGSRREGAVKGCLPGFGSLQSDSVVHNTPLNYIESSTFPAHGGLPVFFHPLPQSGVDESPRLRIQCVQQG